MRKNPAKGPGHGFKSGLQDIDAVYAPWPDNAKAPGRGHVFYERGKLFPLGGSQFLGVIKPCKRKSIGQDDGAGNNWPRKASSAYFVNTDNA